MNPLTGQSGVFEADDGNPLAKPPTLADGWQYNAAAYKQWADAQRQEGIKQGLIDPETGWPTGAALVDAAHQWGNALIGSTSAPGGGVSAGSVIDNPAFQKWFGASKAVDAGGKPLVLYHGTGSDFGQFNTKNGAFFSSSPHVASTYSTGVNGGNVVPAYASLEKPLIVEANGAPWNAIPTSSQIHLPEITRGTSAEDDLLSQLLGNDSVGSSAPYKVPAKTSTIKGEITDTLHGVVNTNHLTKWAKENGYDGVIFRNIVDRGPNHDNEPETTMPATNIVAFNPTQIKSAIGNGGAFNPRDPRITAGIAGLTAGGAAAASGGDNTQ